VLGAKRKTPGPKPKKQPGRKRGPLASTLERNRLIEIKLLEKQRALLAERFEVEKKQAPVLWIEPHEKEEPVYDDVVSGKKGVVFQGGNRSGKTFWLITQTIALLYGKEFWGERRELPFKPPVRARLLG